LPAPYAIAAAALGGALADILAGAAVWAPFTAVIKALNTVPFLLVCRKRKTSGIVSAPIIAMSVLSGVITVSGYLLAESLLYGFAAALTSVPFSIIQAAGSAVLFVFFALALDRANFKSKIMKY